MTITTDFVRLNAVLTKTVPSFAQASAATSDSLNTLFQDLYGNSTAANTQAAIQIAANLGLTGNLADVAQVYIATQLNAASYAQRGETLAVLASYLAETPAGNNYKATADAFNAAVTTAASQAATAGFAGGAFVLTPPAPPPPPVTASLTASADSLVGTANQADVFTGAAGTLRNADVIVDPTKGDGDVLNVTVTGTDITANTTGTGLDAAGPTISNIESININVSAFGGTARVINAQNMSTGTNLTIGSTNPAFSGEVGVQNLRGVNFIAGDAVTRAVITNVSSGIVDAGKALALVLSADASRTDTVNVKVNGDITLGIRETAGIVNANIEATANSIVDIRGVTLGTTTYFVGGAGGDATREILLAEQGAAGATLADNGLGSLMGVVPGSMITTSGPGNITLRGLSTDFSDGGDARFITHKGEGTLSVRLDDAAGARTLDLSNTSGVTGLILPAGNSVTATIYTGTTVSPRPGATSYTATVLQNAEPITARLNSSELNVTLGGNASTALTISGFASTNFTQTASQTITTLTYNAAAPANATGVTTSSKFVFNGAGDLTITNAPTVGTVDASNIEGGLTYTAPAAGQAVLGGKGTNVITTNAANSISYTGQNSGDTVNLQNTTGSANIVLGSGNDTVRLVGGVLTTGIISAQLGAGGDTILIGLDASSNVARTVAPGPQAAVNVLNAGGRLILDGGEGADTLRLAAGVNLAGAARAGMGESAASNGTQSLSKVTNFERIELQEANGDRGADSLASPLSVTVGSFVVNNSSATVAVRYGLDADGVRYATADTTVGENTRLTIDDNVGAFGARNIDLSGLKFDITRLVDQVVILTGAGNDSVKSINTLAGQTVRINAGVGVDSIVVGDGPGITHVILGAGSKTVDLSAATSANVLVFANGTGVAANNTTVTGVHTIKGWKPQTLLDLEAFAVAPAGFGTAAPQLGVLGVQSVISGDAITVISTTGAAANLTLEGTAVITNFRSAEQTANYLAERFTIGVAPDDSGVIVINDTRPGSNMSYIWYFDDAAAGLLGSTGDAGGDFDASELTLLAVVENGGIGLTTANFTSIDQATLVAVANQPNANIYL